MSRSPDPKYFPETESDLFSYCIILYVALALAYLIVSLSATRSKCILMH
jgi:hypothetical protein